MAGVVVPHPTQFRPIGRVVPRNTGARSAQSNYVTNPNKEPTTIQGRAENSGIRAQLPRLRLVRVEPRARLSPATRLKA